MPPTLQLPADNGTLTQLSLKLSGTMEYLHKLYRQLKDMPQMSAEQVAEFDAKLRFFARDILTPFIDYFKAFCNEQTEQLWNDVRSAQIQRMVTFQPMQSACVDRLVSFYSYMYAAAAACDDRRRELAHAPIALQAAQAERARRAPSRLSLRANDQQHLWHVRSGARAVGERLLSARAAHASVSIMQWPWLGAC